MNTLNKIVELKNDKLEWEKIQANNNKKINNKIKRIDKHLHELEGDLYGNPKDN